MSSLLAILIVASLFTIALLPIALSVRGVLPARPVAIGYGVVILAVMTYQLGVFTRTPIAEIKADSVRASTLSAAQCAEVFSLLERARIVIDRRDPPRLVVARVGWAQLPPEAQAAAVACLERNRAPGQATPVEVVQQ